MFDYSSIQKELLQKQDQKYQKFTQKLLPDTDGIIGVRLPEIRRIAGRIAKEDIVSYLTYAKPCSFEETMLLGFVIGKMNTNQFSISDILQYILDFIPKINNWSICDSFCCSLKVAKIEKQDVFIFLKKVLEKAKEDPNDSSKNVEFRIRFVVVMFLNYYIDAEHMKEVMELLTDITSDAYYINMAIAWCFSMIYVKFPDYIVNYLKQNISFGKLNRNQQFIHNVTIQKICDSHQVTKEAKAEIKKFRLKND